MNKRGITLISLIITVIILLILMGISMDLIINKKIFSSAEEVVNKSEKQMDTHQEVTEEVRNTIKPPDIATGSIITFMVGSAVFLTKRGMRKIKFPLQQPTGVAQVFEGWYYDAECTQEAKEGDNITQDITLYANMLGIINPLNGTHILLEDYYDDWGDSIWHYCKDESEWKLLEVERRKSYPNLLSYKSMVSDQ